MPAPICSDDFNANDWNIVTNKKYKESQVKNWRTSELYPTSRSEGGILVFNSQLTKMLMVYGRHSLKWGPPKGRANDGEKLVDTAIRETAEETGYQFALDDLVNFNESSKFHIILSKIMFFIVIIDENNDIDGVNVFAPSDTNEIAEVKWINIDEIPLLVSNAPTRQLFTKHGNKTRLQFILNTIQNKSKKDDLLSK